MPDEGAFRLDGIDAHRFLHWLEAVDQAADQASAVVLIALPIPVLQRAAKAWADGDEQGQRIHSAILEVRGMEQTPASG